jgi:hypothetical protein
MNQTHLDTVLTQAQQLSLLDKVRLVERLMSTLERDLQPPPPAPVPVGSLVRRPYCRRSERRGPARDVGELAL